MKGCELVVRKLLRRAYDKLVVALPTLNLGQAQFQGSNRRGDPSDWDTIVVGLCVLLGVLSERPWRESDDQATRRLRSAFKVLVKSLESSEGLYSLLTYLDALDDALIAHLSSEREFKALAYRKVASRVDAPSCLSPFRRWLLGPWFPTADGVECARYLHQVFSLLHKLSVEREDLADAALQDALLFEEQQRVDVFFQEQTQDYWELIWDLRRMCLRHLPWIAGIPVHPRHGNGAVAVRGVAGVGEKTLACRSDARIDYLLSRSGLGVIEDYLGLSPKAASARTSRFHAVPKTWKKMRGISMEPPELQFMQQGVFRKMDESFRRSSFWRARVDLHDQARSRELALEGSLTRRWATIDLSSASDSVTLSAVRGVFGNTELARWLLGTRSTHTAYGDAVIRISKFAPMGSACCFPVECVLFTLISQLATDRAAGSHQRESVRVYGDDIIVPSYAYDLTVTYLHRLGFQVNARKSYGTGWFREACGVEAWCGHEIQPFHFRALKIRPGRKSDVREAARLCDYANELFVRGYHSVRSFLLDLGRDAQVAVGNSSHSLLKCIRFSDTLAGDQHCWSPTPTNHHLRCRWNRDLFRREVEFVTGKARVKRKPNESITTAEDAYAYRQWLMAHSDSCLSVGSPALDETIKLLKDRVPYGTTMVPGFAWGPPN